MSVDYDTLARAPAPATYNSSRSVSAPVRTPSSNAAAKRAEAAYRGVQADSKKGKAKDVVSDIYNESTDFFTLDYWSDALFGLTAYHKLTRIEIIFKLVIRFLVMGSFFYLLIASSKNLRTAFSYPTRKLGGRELTASDTSEPGMF